MDSWIYILESFEMIKVEAKRDKMRNGFSVDINAECSENRSTGSSSSFYIASTVDIKHLFHKPIEDLNDLTTPRIVNNNRDSADIEEGTS